MKGEGLTRLFSEALLGDKKYPLVQVLYIKRVPHSRGTLFKLKQSNVFKS